MDRGGATASSSIPRLPARRRRPRHHNHDQLPTTKPLLLLMLSLGAVQLLLLLPTATHAFLPPALSPQRRHRAAAVVVGMGSKWKKDPGLMDGVAELVKGFKKREHEQTETVDRYLQVRVRGVLVLADLYIYV